MPPMQGPTETCEGVLYSVLNCDFQLGHLEFIILLGLFFTWIMLLHDRKPLNFQIYCILEMALRPQLKLNREWVWEECFQWKLNEIKF